MPITWSSASDDRGGGIGLGAAGGIGAAIWVAAGSPVGAAIAGGVSLAGSVFFVTGASPLQAATQTLASASATVRERFGARIEASALSSVWTPAVEPGEIEENGRPTTRGPGGVPRAH